MKKKEKIPKQIKISLDKGKLLDKEWDENHISFWVGAFCEKKLKKVEEDQSLLDLENRFVEGYNFDLKNIGDGQEKEVFDIKNKMFSTKKMQKSK